MAINSYPREDVSASEKKKDKYFKDHLDWAEGYLNNNNSLIERMNKSFDGYNGVKPAGSVAWLEQSYGQINKSRYIAYRLGRTKIDLLNGESLKRPLQATVTTINSKAMTEKMQAYDFMKGAMIAKKEIEDVKNIAGVDVMNGVQIPNGETDPAWKQMSFKDKCEDMAQIILDNQVKDLDLKKKLYGDAFLNLEISNYCFFKIERNETGDIEAQNIRPQDRIIVDIEGDDYGEKSPIKGCRQEISVQQVLMKYNLTKEQRDQLNNARGNMADYCGASGKSRGYMRESAGDLLCTVIHIEWLSVTPEYYKIVPKTKSQLELDSSEEFLTFEIDAEKYEANKENYDRGVEKGLYTIETKYRQEEYEATRIGGLIDVNCRRTYFQKRGVDNPAYILSSSYYSYVHGRVNGVSLSLQQVIENFENIYDIAMYKILQDFSRMKGKALTIDRGALGKNETTVGQLYKLINDGVVDYDSSAATNLGGRPINPADMFKVVDLGLSDSFQQLIAFRNDIRHELDSITGINESRMGVTAASSTATAQQSDVANSRTITESLFYGFSGFVKRVMMGVLHSSAISWAFYKIEKGEQILGSEKFKFLQITQDIGFRDYGMDIEDGSRYMEISQKIEQMMQISLNAKEIRPMDALNVLLANTIAQKRAFLESSWIELKDQLMQSDAANNQAQAQIEEMRLRTQVDIANADREDRQQARLVEIDAQADADIRVNQNKTSGDLMKEGFKAQSEAINQQPPI